MNLNVLFLDVAQKSDTHASKFSKRPTMLPLLSVKTYAILIYYVPKKNKSEHKTSIAIDECVQSFWYSQIRRWKIDLEQLFGHWNFRKIFPEKDILSFSVDFFDKLTENKKSFFGTNFLQILRCFSFNKLLY